MRLLFNLSLVKRFVFANLLRGQLVLFPGLKVGLSLGCSLVWEYPPGTI